MYEFERNESGQIAADDPRDVRVRLPLDGIASALSNCRRDMRSFLLPHQQQAALSCMNALAERHDRASVSVQYGSAHEAGLFCDGTERAFVDYWTSPPNQRLNGVQQWALSLYREGRYAGARLVADVAGVDGGMAWALVGHLRATSDSERAQRQLEATFSRLCSLGESMSDELNASISADAADEMADHNTDAPDYVSMQHNSL